MPNNTNSLKVKRPINKIPRLNIKKAVKTSPKPNRLESPYKNATAKTAAKPTVKPTAKPESRTLTFGDTTIELPRDQHKLEAMKEAALEYWRNLPVIS